MRAAVVLIVAMLAGAPDASQQPAKSASAQNPPPITYVCPMKGDEDVLEDKPGKCPKCGMTLLPIRLESVWTCPVHPVITESKPGTCPIDHRDLVPVTMQVSWTCPGRPDSNNPGKCPDGSPMTRKYSARAHGNHNPQHGGQFFMAADNWHHLEGAYLPNGVFRLYLYDDFTKPLAAAKARAVTARVVLKQTYDPSTRTTNEIEAVPLVRNGPFLEARIGARPLPAQMSAKVKFEPGKPENLFDFTFESYSKDPGAGAPRITSTSPPPAPKPGDRPPVSAATAAAAPDPVPTVDPATTATIASAVDPALIPVPIPETVPEMLDQLKTRAEQIRTFIDRGSFASIYVPAFQAKDVALALDAHKGELPVEKRKVAEPAIARLVRSAYLLDAFGDIGNKQQIIEAYAMFSAALKDIEASFPR